MGSKKILAKKFLEPKKFFAEFFLGLGFLGSKKFLAKTFLEPKKIFAEFFLGLGFLGSKKNLAKKLEPKKIFANFFLEVGFFEVKQKKHKMKNYFFLVVLFWGQKPSQSFSLVNMVCLFQTYLSKKKRKITKKIKKQFLFCFFFDFGFLGSKNFSEKFFRF